MDVELSTRTRREQGRELPLLVWRFPTPVRVIGSAPHGGGVGVRRWAINAQVPAGYARRDPDHHLGQLGISLGLAGRGVGMLTAADVRRYTCGVDGGVEATATVGLGHPILAAAADEGCADLVGTINLVVLVPERLPGVSEVIRPDHHDVANAIGAAIASVSGQVDRIFQFGPGGRSAAVEEAKGEAHDQAVRAGADPDAVEIVEVEELPLAYLNTPAVRIRVKAAGPLSWL